MTDRSARGPSARGYLPLVFALVLSTGCAQDSAPPFSAPPLIKPATTANSNTLHSEHHALVAPGPRIAGDSIHLASAIDVPSADTSRRSKLSQLADALNSPDDAAAPSTTVADDAGPVSTPTYIPGKVEPKSIFTLNPADIAAAASREAHAAESAPQEFAAPQKAAEPIATAEQAATPKPAEVAPSTVVAPPTDIAHPPASTPSEVAAAAPVKPIESLPVESNPAEISSRTASKPIDVAPPTASIQPEVAIAPAPTKQLEVPAPALTKKTEVAVSPPPSEPAELPNADTLLPWGPSKVSPEMAAICGRAEDAARAGFNLAQRGALYSARAQFIDSLQIITEALDAQHNTSAHARALNAGLRALQEVNDFTPHTGQLVADLNLRILIDSHHTPVLKDYPLDHLTALQAQRMYLSYAQEQLAAAGEDQPVASLSLHGLGKICTVPPEMHGPPEQIAEAKAVVYHQAALMVEPKNFMAANELGVLLAHFGRLPEARSALEHAIAVSGGPTEWQNLAAVCDRMNDPAKAAEARQQSLVAVNKLQGAGFGTAGMKYPIQWLDPASFATTNSMVADAAPASSTALTSVMAKNPPADSTNTPAIAAKPQQPKSGFWNWLK